MNTFHKDEQQYTESAMDVIPLEARDDVISPLHRCQSNKARKLCIYDSSYKLKYNSEFDIGGSYTGTDSEPDLWFYYTTSTCPGNNHLLNLFVCYRKTGSFSVSVSNSNTIIKTKIPDDLTGRSSLLETLIQYSFKSTQPDEHFYIKTFCFSDKNAKALENNTLIIPVKIELKLTHSVDREVIRRIKLEHDFGDLLSKGEKTDFVLQSAACKYFSVHKIILAAHSPVLRNMIKSIDQPSLTIDISNHDMDLLLQFIYTGTIKDLLNQDCLKLLEIADKFQLKNLFLLTQYAIGEQINIKNAVEVALLSEKYKLTQLQDNVFKFIKYNPAVMETEGWNNLADVNLAKKLFQYIHTHGPKN